MKKRILVALLVASMSGAMLTGCGTISSNDVVATVGDTDIKGNVANFYTRYLEAQYETYYGSYLGDDMWTTEIEDGETYEDNVKDSAMKSLKQFYVLKNHMSDYDVEITEEEKADIEKAAKKFEDANELAPKKAVDGDAKTVAEVLTLYKIQAKMKAAIVKDVDTNVSDEDAAQKSMQYVKFAFTTTDDSGNETTLSEEEQQKLTQQATDLQKSAKKKPKNFEKLAKKAGVEVQTATFDSESTDPDATVIAAADKLEKNAVSDVIVTDDAVYIAKLTSVLDREATDAKKKEIAQERQDTEFDSVVKKLLKKDGSSVHKLAWSKIDFTKLGITIGTDESNPYDSIGTQEEDTSGTTTEDAE